MATTASGKSGLAYNFYEIVYKNQVYNSDCVNWFLYLKELEDSMLRGRVSTSVALVGLTGVNNEVLQAECNDLTIALSIVDEILLIQDPTVTTSSSSIKHHQNCTSCSAEQLKGT